MTRPSLERVAFRREVHSAMDTITSKRKEPPFGGSMHSSGRLEMASAGAALAAPSSAPAAKPAAGTLLARLGHVNGHGPALKVLAVQRGDGGLGRAVRLHLHKAEALAAAGVAVGDHLGAPHGAVRRKQLFQVRARGLVAQVPHV